MGVKKKKKIKYKRSDKDTKTKWRWIENKQSETTELKVVIYFVSNF